MRNEKTQHKGKPKKPENETSTQAFIRIINPKTISTIAKLRQIARCTGSKYYDVTQEQVTTMTTALQKEIQDIQVRYDSRIKTTSKEDIKGLL